MRALRTSLPPAAVLTAGVPVVHELRYRLAFGADADAAEAAHGHAYLGVLLPVLVGGLAVLAGLWLLALARAPRASAGAVRMRRLWPVATAVLLALYSGQELLEGALSPGHPAGLDALLAGSGWVAAPIAVLGGGAVALVCRVGHRIAEWARERHRSSATQVGADSRVPSRPRAQARTPRSAVLARHLAGRAPPRVGGCPA